MTAAASGAGVHVACGARLRVAVVTVAVALGCGFLAARPAIVAASSAPVVVLTALFVGLLLVGALVRVPSAPPPGREGAASGAGVAIAVTVVGVAAFLVARLLVGGPAPVAPTAGAVAANSLAAVAEEVWFRRLCYGMLAPAGTAYAVVASAFLFAVVHVGIYGAWVLPLDLAAGLLLGWQRAATGSWHAPAVTHVVANLLAIL
jgi:hypothetical protein